jgi:hypothetical protein
MGRKCPSDCSCGLHGRVVRKKCETGCTCKRHAPNENKGRKISESWTPQRRLELAERSRARSGATCESGCTCGKHTPEEGRGQKISAAKTGVVCLSGCACKRHDRNEETRNKIGDSNRGMKRSEEVRRKKSEALSGVRFNGEPARGFSYRGGYKILTGQQSHPLTQGRGSLAEHRKVLYDAIGPGPHPCHWGCGRILDWNGRSGLIPDHINGNRIDNRLENLVPSCPRCNTNRAWAGNPTEWDPWCPKLPQHQLT